MKVNVWALCMKYLMAIVTAIWLSVPFAIKVLALLLMIETLTTLFTTKASFSKTAKTSALILSLTLLVHYFYSAVQLHTTFNLGFDLATAVCVFYALGSAMDILTNFRSAGVQIPSFLVAVLTKAQEQLNDRSKVAKSNRE